MKLLVTGGAGYIGLQTVRLLKQQGHYCVLYDNLSTGNREFTQGDKLIVGDLLDPQALEAVFAQTRFDAVLHFAAATSVGESIERPLFYYEQNVAATLHLLAAMRKHGVTKLIFSSSAAVYGEPSLQSPLTPPLQPIDEDTPCLPVNPYGRSKRMVEEILEDLFQREWLQYITLRYFNAAGADPEGGLGERRLQETHLIPCILGEIRRALADKRKPTIKIFGQHYPTSDGTCVRDFVHVRDVAEAHLLALRALNEKRHTSRIYNVGGGKGSSVLEVVQMAAEIAGTKIDLQSLPPRPGDPPALVARTRRIQEELGFAPQYSDLRTILESAWAWESKRPR